VDNFEEEIAQANYPTLRLFTSPRLRSAHPAYQWLHRLHCVGVGEADLQRFVVAYDVYAVQG